MSVVGLDMYLKVRMCPLEHIDGLQYIVIILGGFLSLIIQRSFGHCLIVLSRVYCGVLYHKICFASDLFFLICRNQKSRAKYCVPMR